MYRIFDSHTHVYPELLAAKATAGLGSFYNFTVEGKGTYPALEQDAKESGTDGFLLFCVATNAHQVPHVNDSISELVRLSRSRGFSSVGFAGMHQDFPDFEGELNRCLAMGLHGVKMHPDIQRINADDPKLMPLYESMQAKNMTLYLHVGDDRPEYRFSEATRVARIAKAFPRLKIVAAHLGGYKAWQEATVLFGLDNLWYDCSSALWAMSADDAVKQIGKCGFDRVMYGSDYPVMNLKKHLSIFMRLNLTQTQRENILWNNAQALLGF